MDRPIVYPAAIPLDTDILDTNVDAMVAIGSVISLAADLSGGRVVIDGLYVVPTAPASMRVVVIPGRAFAERVVDATPYSVRSSNSDVIGKGARTDGATYLLAAPSQPGTAQRYLIQATVSERDDVPIPLPYYNAANPSQGYSGPENSGQAQNTRRLSIVSLQLKVGVPATVGQATNLPVDNGWVAVAEIEVRNGDISLDSTRITQRTDGRLPKLGDLMPKSQMSGYATGGDLAAEAAARAAADVAEAQARDTADRAELNARAGEDVRLAQLIAGVAQARADGDAAEARDRDAADRSINGRIDAEATARDASDRGILAQIDTSFASSYQGNGYGWQKMRGGIILQWGQGSVPASGEGTTAARIPFPMAFPSGCMAVMATLGGTGHQSPHTYSNSVLGWQPTISAREFDATSFFCSVDNLSTGDGPDVGDNNDVPTDRALGLNFFAIGW